MELFTVADIMKDPQLLLESTSDSVKHCCSLPSTTMAVSNRVDTVT